MSSPFVCNRIRLNPVDEVRQDCESATPVQCPDAENQGERRPQLPRRMNHGLDCYEADDALAAPDDLPEAKIGAHPVTASRVDKFINCISTIEKAAW